MFFSAFLITEGEHDLIDSVLNSLMDEISAGTQCEN